MSGNKPRAPLPPLTEIERKWAVRLRQHTEVLAGEIGGRSLDRPGSLDAALDYLQRELTEYGYHPTRQTYRAYGHDFQNLECRGADGRVVVGAHYDTAGGLPGANDNGSGVAAVLELARSFAGHAAGHRLRFVFFANEEPPYFQTDAMGSYQYAKRCREYGEDIRAMFSLETIGYYSDEPGSQTYPSGFHPGYPDRGDFLGFVSDVRSAMLLRRALHSFRQATALPAQGAALPAGIPGVAWSDHWSFWQFGYRAVMVTDTAPFRYPHYHSANDTPDKLDYERMARALTGLRAAILEVIGE